MFNTDNSLTSREVQGSGVVIGQPSQREIRSEGIGVAQQILQESSQQAAGEKLNQRVCLGKFYFFMGLAAVIIALACIILTPFLVSPALAAVEGGGGLLSYTLQWMWYLGVLAMGTGGVVCMHAHRDSVIQTQS